jgi:stage V sporulation protein SpoVS
MVASARRKVTQGFSPALQIAPAIICVVALAACRTGVPVVDANPGPSSVSGTITGTLSSADGKAGIVGRRIAAVNVATGERIATVTSETGGYTLKVTPARYRIEVELAEGETIVKDAGTFNVSRSELQHDVDIRIGVKRSGGGRIYQPPLPSRAPTV